MIPVPRLPIWLTCRAAPPELRESLAGDLVEEYRRRWEANRIEARRWLWRQAAVSWAPFLRFRVRRSVAGRELAVLVLGLLAVELCFRLYNVEWFLNVVRSVDGANQRALVVSLNLLASATGGLITGGFAVRGGFRETVALVALLTIWSVTAQVMVGAGFSGTWVLSSALAVAAAGWTGIRLRAGIRQRLPRVV